MMYDMEETNMSFWDNVKKFAQPYADDEYDDYDELEGYEEEASQIVAMSCCEPRSWGNMLSS